MKSKQLKVINPVPDITLFAVNMITRGFQHPGWKKYIGLNFDETVSAYKNNFVEWCVPLPLWRKLGKVFFKKISTDKAFVRQVYQKHYYYGRQLYANCDVIRKKDTRLLTESQILKDFKKIQHSFNELCFWGVIPPVIDFENNLLTSWLEQKLEGVVKKYPIRESLQEAFSIFTTPKELTYLQKESDDLLKLAAKNKATENDIKKHQYTYCWTDYGYMGPVHTLLYYKRRLKQIKKGSRSLTKKIREIIRGRIKIQKRQDVLARQLHLDAKTQYLFRIAREFMVLKLYRKEVMFKGYHVFDLLFKEIGCRFGYTIQQLRYCLPDEIIQIMQGKTIDRKELTKRVQTYFLHAFIRERDYFYYGKKARTYMANNLFKEKINTGVKQIKGMSACVGRVSGTAKIVNTASEMTKVKKGDVLISIATSPAVLPAMKLASAFVTDTGGITCHAAIVDREMKKPCVIGTKIATKVFKDGDKVEVDADNGIVKKL